MGRAFYSSRNFNLTTDDVHDQREALGLNKEKKPQKIYVVKNNEGAEVFRGRSCDLGSKIQKHFGLTARWSKRGRWREVLMKNNFTITEQ